MIAAPSTTPSGSDDDVNTRWNASSRQATSIASMKAPNIATPPSVAVGTSCTLRSSGATTAPNLIEMARTIGVRTNVATAATPPIVR